MPDCKAGMHRKFAAHQVPFPLPDYREDSAQAGRYLGASWAAKKLAKSYLGHQQVAGHANCASAGNDRFIRLMSMGSFRRADYAQWQLLLRYGGNDTAATDVRSPPFMSNAALNANAGEGLTKRQFAAPETNVSYAAASKVLTS